MSILIVYFSFTGNNRFLAEHIAQRIECDVCSIIEKKRRTMVTIILDMMLKRDPKIRPLEYSVSNYNHIILVAPIWDSKIANPMKTLIKTEKDALSNYSFITLCGYERIGQIEDITEELSVLIERTPKAVVELRISDILPIDKRDEIKAISRYQISSKDLLEFDSKINEFLECIEK